MEANRQITTVALLALLLAPVASGQVLERRAPEVRGVWNPVIGSGAVYQWDAKSERKIEWEIAVVGSETVEGKPGYWLEMAAYDAGEGERAYIKHLMVVDGKQIQVKRMIMQAAGQPPMEFPIEMLQRAGRKEQPADMREQAERIGTESVTTPAGTFTCEHWRLKDGSADVWYTEKVAPYGLVKMAGKDGNMTLVRVVSGAKSRITGTPQKFDFNEMMRQPKP